MLSDNKQQYIKEEILRKQLIRKSPFNSGDSTIYTACVGENGRYDQSAIYDGFKNTVNTLVESIGEYKNFADPMVYPILFCVRHCIELFLKDLNSSIQYIKSVKENRNILIKLKKANRIKSKLEDQIIDKDKMFSFIEINEKRQEILQERLKKIEAYIGSLTEECFKGEQKEDFTHNLNELIQKIITNYCIDTRIKEAFDSVLPLLNFYKDIDPNGDAFRYLADKGGNPHFESKKIQHVNLKIVSIQFEEITNLFRQINWIMFCLTKEYNTGTFTKDLSRKQLEEISRLLPQPNEFNEKIKEVKNQVKITYNIGSNKFNDALKIIRSHREFSSYIGEEKKFASLSEKTIKIFVECSLKQRKWEEASKEISINELKLLCTFSEMTGWRYVEKELAYFSEDLELVYSNISEKYNIIGVYINPSIEIDYVIKGMKKCGQITYAKVMEEYLLKLKK